MKHRECSNTDTRDVLAPLLFRGGVRGTRTEGFLLPRKHCKLTIKLQVQAGGSSSLITEMKEKM